jgi:hypothetical protein
MNLTVYTQNVYEPYATSHFNGHSLLTTGSIIAGIVRIVSYPLLAKLANVRLRQALIMHLLTKLLCSILVDRKVSLELPYRWLLAMPCTRPVATSIPF